MQLKKTRIPAFLIPSHERTKILEYFVYLMVASVALPLIFARGKIALGTISCMKVLVLHCQELEVFLSENIQYFA